MLKKAACSLQALKESAKHILCNNQSIKFFKKENHELSVVSERSTSYFTLVQSFCTEFLVSYRKLLTIWYLGDLIQIIKSKKFVTVQNYLQ